MRIKLLEYRDESCPGTIDPDDGERPREDPGYVDIDDPDPRMLRMIEEDGGLHVPFPMLLAPEHFTDVPADARTRNLLGVVDDPTRTGENSAAVDWVFSGACSGWGAQPTPAELRRALLDPDPDNRAKAVISAWADEAEDGDIIQAYAEGAFTFRELAAGLHRAGLGRSPMSAKLNVYRHEEPVP